jgi:hypothetical protein
VISRFSLPFILLAALTSNAGAWQVETIETPGRIRELTEVDGEPRIATASGWFRAAGGGEKIRFETTPPPRLPPLPAGALPDARIASGRGSIVRAWLAEPTDRYKHGVLGDAIEAGSLIVERADGKRDEVRLGGDAVFEFIEPRIATIGDNEKIVVVKSYLSAGSSLAVIGDQAGRMTILSETPPIGTPNRWLNPAGIADFDGDGATEIALVRMPHALGRLELWRWSDGKLVKAAEIGDTSNHMIGSRALHLSAVADFNGDGVVDLAIPSFDRRSVRILSFHGAVREIARIPLPAAVTMDFVALPVRAGPPEILLGLSDGRLLRLRQ